MKSKKFYLLFIVFSFFLLQSKSMASPFSEKTSNSTEVLENIGVKQKTKDCRYPPCE